MKKEENEKKRMESRLSCWCPNGTKREEEEDEATRHSPLGVLSCEEGPCREPSQQVDRWSEMDS